VSQNDFVASILSFIFFILNAFALSAVAARSAHTSSFLSANPSGVIPVAFLIARFVARSIFHWLDMSPSATFFRHSVIAFFTALGGSLVALNSLTAAPSGFGITSPGLYVTDLSWSPYCSRIQSNTAFALVAHSVVLSDSASFRRETTCIRWSFGIASIMSFQERIASANTSFGIMASLAFFPHFSASSHVAIVQTSLASSGSIQYSLQSDDTAFATKENGMAGRFIILLARALLSQNGTDRSSPTTARGENAKSTAHAHTLVSPFFTSHSHTCCHHLYIFHNHSCGSSSICHAFSPAVRVSCGVYAIRSHFVFWNHSVNAVTIFSAASHIVYFGLNS